MNKVALLGAGNIGHALAALLGSRPSLQVVSWGPRWSKRSELQLTAYGRDGTYAIGVVTAEPSLTEAVAGAAVVVLAVPTSARRRLLERIQNHLDDCALLVAWEGTGWFREDLAELGIVAPMAVGLQRSPILSRVRELGRSVEILGVRTEVVAAATRKDQRSRAGQLLQAILPFKFAMAPRYACVSVSPGNPLIHPARLYACHTKGAPLPEGGLAFYGDWDDASSEVLLQLHHELAALRGALRLPVQFLSTLVDRPVVQTPSEVTHDIQSERYLHEIRMPVRRTAGGIALDRRHRFFTEDIGEGLAHILDIARQASVRMPVASAIHSWYRGSRRSESRPAVFDDAPGRSLR